MQFKLLKKANPKNLFNYGAVVFIIGLALGTLGDSGLFILLLSHFLKFMGLILLLQAGIKMKRRKERLEKENLVEKIPMGKIEEMKKTSKKTNKILLALFLSAILAFLCYWFIWKPQQIRMKCFKSIINTTIDSTNESQNDLDEAYEDCLREYE